MKKLPPNTIFSVKRAAELLEIEPSDLLLMGAVGSIYLGVILHDVTAVLGHPITDLVEHETMDCARSMGDKNSIFYCFDPELYQDQEEEHLGSRYNTGYASGLWNLNREKIMEIVKSGRTSLGQFLSASYNKIDQDIDSYADSLLLGCADKLHLPEDIFKNLEKEKFNINQLPETVITQDDLFISRAWVEHIGEYMDKNLPIQVKFFVEPGARELKSAENLKHGNTTRFSLNRENCLMALIFTKRNHPEDCKNSSGMETNDAWANATRDHWHYVGAGYQEPSVDFLKKIISDMDRKPEDRTTAGKPKGSDTKN